MRSRPIRLHGIRQNQLKNIHVEIPSQQFTVITGVSGSGKSSLAWDTLYAEGQRRYLDSLSSYIRQFLERIPPPDLDSAENIPPAIALEQRNRVSNSRSTVGTQTEILDGLRLLFAKAGKPFCPDCQQEMTQHHSHSILTWAIRWLPGKKALLGTPLVLKRGSPFTDLNQLKTQGFHRVAWQNKNSSHLTVVNLHEVQSETELLNLQTKEPLFLIIDRFSSLSEHSMGPEKCEDLLNSIEQSLKIGQGKLLFWELHSDPLQPYKCYSFQTHTLACPQCSTPAPLLHSPLHFSFHSPMGACPQCSGFGYTLDLAENLVVPDPELSLQKGAIDPFTKPSCKDWQKELLTFAQEQSIPLNQPYSQLSLNQKKRLWKGDPTSKGKKSRSFLGIEACFEELKRWKYKIQTRIFIRRYQIQNLCSLCQGTRLKKETQFIRVGGKNIQELSSFSCSNLRQWLKNDLALSLDQKKILQTVEDQLHQRLLFLERLGIGYLEISRLTKTLSGGEFQRIRLATQLGQGLCGTLYILDEPSIGLHAADTQQLIQILWQLRDQGNTVVVVEHDLDLIRAADWIIELGPGSGIQGGQVLAQGSPQTISKNAQSIIRRYLVDPAQTQKDAWVPKQARSTPTEWLKITGCRTHHLKKISVEFPLRRWVVLTGVSGSGKSSLIHHTLYPALQKANKPSFPLPSSTQYETLTGAETIDEVVLLDQTPIGKNARSNPATYLKIWEDIRTLFSQQILARQKKFSPATFSFNTGKGRCPDCEGSGETTVEMHFMADVCLPCETCQGKRFRPQTLEVTYKNHSIDQVLGMTADEALSFFSPSSSLPQKLLTSLQKKLHTLQKVGLGYLPLGQSAALLSGGESQRLKIAASLLSSKKRKSSHPHSHTLYLLDEPTQGLHLEDIRHLIPLLQSLVSEGNSLILIEHHLDLIRHADWVIDLGPAGGAQGGEVLAAGPPDSLCDSPRSITGQILSSKEKGKKIF